MTAEEPRRSVNVYETVAYSTDKLLLAYVPLALFLGLLGLTMLAFRADAKPMHFVAAGILIAASIFWIAYALLRRASPGKPVIELSPAGLLFRIQGTKQVRIPWREISAVEAVQGRMSLASILSPRTAGAGDITGIRISRAFYDRQIHIPSAVMRGPGWQQTFRVEEKSARISLDPQILSVAPEELRCAVEERWKAFGPQASAIAEAARDNKPDTAGAFPRSRKAIADKTSAGLGVGQIWYAMKIVVLLAGIAAMLSNILGYWQTNSQREARATHDYWQDQYRKWDEDEKRSAEERRKKDKEWEEFWRKNNF